MESTENNLSQKISLPDVRNYSNVACYLRDYLDSKKKAQPGFSVRAWAQRMGFKNHSLLILLLSEKREIKPRHLSKIFKGIQVNNSQKLFLTALVHYKNAETETERSFYYSKLKELVPGEREVFLDMEKAKFVANPLHATILEMTQLENVSLDPEFISTSLVEKVSQKEIKEAVQRLISLGLLQENNGKLNKTYSRLTIGGEVPSAFVRDYHKKNLQLAYDSIENQKMSERILHGFSIAMDPKILPQIEDLAQKFRKDVEKLSDQASQKNIYQINFQIFKRTKEIQKG